MRNILNGLYHQIITQDTWTETKFYGETYDEILNRTWEIFSNLVKYKVRYIFNDIEVEDYQYISQKPSLILEDISKFIEELNLVKKFQTQLHYSVIFQNLDNSEDRGAAKKPAYGLF